MSPQRTYTLDEMKETLRAIIRDEVPPIIHAEMRNAFGPDYEPTGENAKQRWKTWEFAEGLREKSEAIGGKIVMTFLSLILAGLAALGFFGKLPFTGVGK